MRTTVFTLFTAMLTLAIGFPSTSHAATVTFDWATIGNPGNADDNHGDGYGGVADTFRISKHEVTNAQYTEFLNAVAATDTHLLYNPFMGSSTVGGIVRSGSSGSYTYALKADSIGNGTHGTSGDDYIYANKPVVFVTFTDAMRFTNWLHNGQPTGAQAPGTTEAGVYTLGTGISEVRSPNATYFIPSEDEWYKAAYYDPNKPGGAGYYDYPTSTDVVPNTRIPPADNGNSINFINATGNQPYPLTNVGEFALSPSPYGTFDQGGNVYEWNETLVTSSFRGLRGGGWRSSFGPLSALERQGAQPISELESDFLGFRVASRVPEPSTAILGALAALGLLMRRRRLN